ncbi:MAG: hypothetical protein IPI23_01070 [Bacteroidetes bacterium]|nr:hypothetical protein [Bacteroidota bacterium]
MDSLIRRYMHYLDNLDYKERLEESAIKTKIKGASSYFYGMHSETIFQDYVNYDAPIIKTPNKYFDELFTLFKELNIGFQSRVLFDTTLTLVKSNFPTKYSDVIFKSDKKIKFGGLFTGKKNFSYTRIGVIRNFSGVNSLDKSISLNDTLFLFWIYKENIAPRLILSTPKSDGKKFEGSYWLSEPTKIELSEAQESAIDLLVKFYASIDGLPSNPNEIITINEKYLKSEVVEITSDLSIDNSKEILSGKEYLNKISALKSISHSASDLKVEKETRDSDGYSFIINLNLKASITDGDYSATNNANVMVAVSADWKNRKFSNFKIEKIQIPGTLNSEIKQEQKPETPPNDNSNSTNEQELLKILDSKGRDLANSYMQFLKNRSGMKSLFANSTGSVVQVSNYSNTKINNYVASKYEQIVNQLDYDKINFDCEITEMGKTIKNNGKYWVGEIKIKQVFSGTYLSNSSNNYCDITNKILEIYIFKKDNNYILKIGKVRVIGNTVKDDKCTASQK